MISSKIFNGYLTSIYLTQGAVSQPSTVIEWPVTYDAASEQSQTKASAASSGQPTAAGDQSHFPLMFFHKSPNYLP